MKTRATPIVVQVYMVWRYEKDQQENHEAFEERVKGA